MQDLRGRVMDLLDDPSLEAVKVTDSVDLSSRALVFFCLHSDQHYLFIYFTCSKYKLLFIHLLLPSPHILNSLLSYVHNLLPLFFHFFL